MQIDNQTNKYSVICSLNFAYIFILLQHLKQQHILHLTKPVQYTTAAPLSSLPYIILYPWTVYMYICTTPNSFFHC